MKIIIHSVVIVVVFILCGCSNEDNVSSLKFGVKSVWHSECTDKSAFKSENIEKVSIVYTQENTFSIEHQNVRFNCCLPEGISVSVKLSSDTLYFSDKETVHGNCRCMCNYTTQAVLEGLAYKSYLLCLINDDQIIGTRSINFEENMNVEINVADFD